MLRKSKDKDVPFTGISEYCIVNGETALVRKRKKRKEKQSHL